MARRTEGTAIFRASIAGAGKEAAKFNRLQRQLQDSIIAAMRGKDDDLTAAFVAAAPEDTGHLKEQIKTRLFFRARRPQMTVHADRLSGHRGEGRDGYDYLDVTRFGHRVRTIRPKTAPSLAVRYAGHRNPATIRRASEVKGVRPAKDWVETGRRNADKVLDEMAADLGRQVSRRILR